MTACYALNPADLPALLTVWRKNAAVLYPCKEEGDAARLADYEPLMPVSLDYGNLSMPAVDILNGYQDVLFHWNGNERTYEARPGTEDGRPTVLFGIRPCDVAALSYLDEFYLGEYADLNYSRRREALTIVAVNCTQPGKTCFCAATQTGPFARSGYDLLLTPDGDTCWVECATARGEALIAQGAPFFRSVPTADLKARQLMLEEQCRAAFPPLPDMSDARNALLRGFYHPLWDELTPTCIACTGCTAVCPTCTCFQFNEERLSPTSGRRVRVKDSCQAPGFTRNAGGHNPRSKAGAVRHRIMDKLVYIEDRFGKKGCVGCGRCIGVCPADIDIREIVSRITADCPDDGSTPPVFISERMPRRADPQLYTPQPARIVSINDETPDIRRYVVRYTDEHLAETFRLSGQFFMVTVFGVGEVALSIPFGDQHGGEFEFCVKKVGKVTSALAALKPGDIIGLRGPYGKGFPYRSFTGRDVLIVGSGVGLAPVRTIIVRLLQERERYGRIAIIASATSYEGIVYKDDLRRWAAVPGVDVRYALARPTDAVAAHVGYINDLLPELGFDWADSRAILCASPRRIKLVSKDLLQLGMHPAHIYTSLETHMRCGVGKCGHCKVGSHYMCLDGPVFTYEEMLQLPEEF